MTHAAGPARMIVGRAVCPYPGFEFTVRAHRRCRVDPLTAEFVKGGLSQQVLHYLQRFDQFFSVVRVTHVVKVRSRAVARIG